MCYSITSIQIKKNKHNKEQIQTALRSVHFIKGLSHHLRSKVWMIEQNLNIRSHKKDTELRIQKKLCT